MVKNYCNSLIANWKENLNLFLLGAFLVALPTSVALISITAVALLVGWILTGDYRTKWKRLINNKSALLLMSIPFLYLIGLCFTHNFSMGMQELNKSFYWFIFAFVLGSSPPISSKNTYRLFWVYILVVSIAAGVALIKLFFIDTILFFDFRKVTWVDHIPFSYQIAFVIWIVFYFIFYGKFSKFQRFFLLFLIIFLFITLFSLKSFNGYLYFGVMTFTALLMLLSKTKNRIRKFVFLGIFLFISIFPIYYIYHCVKKFYNVTEYSYDEIERYTANGNKYYHNFKDKTKENGNYIGLFLCEKELIPLWNAHSSKLYKSRTSQGYPLSSVIIRYMTSKGLTKDAEGFAKLSETDIENIEKEIPNYIYAENKLGIYPRIYETIWEMDRYKIDHNPNGKTLAQRIELAFLAFKIINKNVWVGIGLGNNTKVYNEIIVETDSKLEPSNIKSSHNQYLNYLIRFGVFGALYILGVLFWVFFKGRKNNPFLITIFFLSMMVANIGDANWETFVGINFFCFFICFLMWTVPVPFPCRRDIKEEEKNRVEIISQTYPTESSCKFSIIIPTWNNLAMLQLCVNSILTNSHFTHQIILHINEGTDGSREWAEQNRLCHTYSLINVGVSLAMNKAASLACTDYIVYLNDDMYVCPDWDYYLWKAIEKQPNNNFFLSATSIEPRDVNKKTAIAPYDFGRSVENFKESELLQQYKDLPFDDWSGASWPPNLLHRSLWEKVGGYSLEFFPGFYSDPDFSMKLWQAGVRRFIGVAESRVYHFLEISTTKINKKSIRDGRKLFLKRWGITARIFYRYYLQMGKKNPQTLKTPKSIAFYFERFLCLFK
ncbi:MAG: glycosyltransferase [Bacteroidales bacterium]|jgi:glycosyltransferase involved in cell wall biosynthesis|nr:glycosyltransferase [Bacteroidales bacterium]